MMVQMNYYPTKGFILTADFKKEIHKFQKANGGILTLHTLALG